LGKAPAKQKRDVTKNKTARVKECNEVNRKDTAKKAKKRSTPPGRGVPRGGEKGEGEWGKEKNSGDDNVGEKKKISAKRGGDGGGDHGRTAPAVKGKGERAEEKNPNRLPGKERGGDSGPDSREEKLAGGQGINTWLASMREKAHSPPKGG